MGEGSAVTHGNQKNKKNTLTMQRSICVALVTVRSTLVFMLSNISSIYLVMSPIVTPVID